MAKPTVFVIDDDESIRDAIDMLLRSTRIGVETFPTSEQFLHRYEPSLPGCVIADVRMPGMSGLELQEELSRRGYPIPVIVLTGYADVPMSVRAVKAGAVDFLEKPFTDVNLVEAVRQALEQDRQTRRSVAARDEIQERIATLTPREHQVMELVVTGHANKEVATRLGISPRTVEIYRGRVMEKMQVRTLPELVLLSIAGRENVEPTAVLNSFGADPLEND